MKRYKLCTSGGKSEEKKCGSDTTVGLAVQPSAAPSGRGGHVPESLAAEFSQEFNVQRSARNLFLHSPPYIMDSTSS
jgi:hypothetical protein